MTTQVFLRQPSASTVCDAWGPGIATWNPNSAFYSTGQTGCQIQALRLSRGVGVTNSTAGTVASSTARHRLPANLPIMWVSPPIDRDVTIASTVTFNLWCLESSMSANVQMGCRVERILGDGSLSATAVVAGATEGVEMNTSARAENFTATPTSTAFSKGDRLLITPYFTNIGTQGGGFTITFDYDGVTAAADGDSYVTFAEDFGFMQDTPGTTSYTTGSRVQDLNWGNGTSSSRTAFSFVSLWDQTLTQVVIQLGKFGSPSDNVELAIQADASGVPSDTDLVSVSVAGSSFSTSPGGNITFDFADTAISSGTYWLVLRRSGAVDAANYYIFAAMSEMPSWGGVQRYYGPSSWGSPSYGTAPVCTISATSVTSSTLYPTGTASDIDPGGAGTDTKEAWTSRGGSAQNAVRNTSSAPASPLLWTTTAGGNSIEWYSKGLQAFTLSGPVLINVRALESTTGANGTVGVEVAVTANDGSGATVWGYTLYGTEVTASDAAYQFFVSGDDVAVTAGQRVRVRFYADDSSAAAMAASLTMTFSYAGTSAAAIGDTYLTFGQSLAENVAGKAGPPMGYFKNLPHLRM